MKKFLEIDFQRSSSRKFSLARNKENDGRVHKQLGRGLFSQEMTHKNKDTIPMVDIRRQAVDYEVVNTGGISA